MNNNPRQGQKRSSAELLSEHFQVDPRDIQSVHSTRTWKKEQTMITPNQQARPKAKEEGKQHPNFRRTLLKGFNNCVSVPRQNPFVQLGHWKTWAERHQAHTAAKSRM